MDQDLGVLGNSIDFFLGIVDRLCPYCIAGWAVQASYRVHHPLGPRMWGDGGYDGGDTEIRLGFLSHDNFAVQSNGLLFVHAKLPPMELSIANL